MAVPKLYILTVDTGKEKTRSVTAVSSDVGEAVGVDKSRWYVAIVGNNTEKSSSGKLEKYGIECYLPIQQETKIWKNGKKATVDRVLIPTILFVRCSEKQRREIVNLPFISRFMVNKAATSKGAFHSTPAVIPDIQIQRLKFMVGNSDTPVSITDKPLKRGDLVRVVRGRLAGLEGEITDMSKDHTELVVAIDFFGCARLEIDTINVEKL